MKHFILIITVVCLFLSCKKEEKREENSNSVVTNIIDLAYAVDHIGSVKLSEIADSIIYLLLETSDKYLVGNRPRILLSSNYIYANPIIFNWDGKYLKTIGKKGQGPGEERYLHKIIDKKNAFYSMADKLISYDMDGKFSGKEKLIIEMKGLDFANADSNIVLCVADSIFFMDNDFNTLSERRVVEPWPEKTTMFNIVDQAVRFFTENNDSVLFYNYMNDTIFRVLDKNISPCWIIELRDQKMPLKHLLGNELKRLNTGSKYFEGGNLEEWDYLKETDNKIRAFAVYETSEYLFVHWLKMREFRQLRNYPPTILQIAYHNKITGKTIAVDGKGFINDINNDFDIFYPSLGTHGDYIVDVKWPFEIMENIEKRIPGKIYNDNLQDIIHRLQDDNNPILIMVKLKKQNHGINNPY